MRIATWNINSVRLRLEHVARFLREASIDVLCLQEIKAATDKFPAAAFAELGYGHAVVEGQPGYNGVAIVSRSPLERRATLHFCGREDARHVSAMMKTDTGPLTLDCVYVPSGGDVADPSVNEKFAHKLAFLEEMGGRFAASPGSLLLGDLNVAPLENDVWSHRQMLGVVSHTEAEVTRFEAARRAGGWIDAGRMFTPSEDKLYTWWSYRARDWRASNRGRRLDHIWSSADVAEQISAIEVYDAARGWEKPSDHAPVIATIASGGAG